MINRDGWAGIVLALFGIFAAILSSRYDFMAKYGPGSGFLPLILSITIVILSVVLFIHSRKQAAASESSNKEDPMFHRPGRVFSSVGVLLLAALFFEKIGFVIVIWAVTAFFVRIVKHDYPLPKCVLVGLITSIAFYVVFSYALGLNLPKGVMPL